MSDERYTVVRYNYLWDQGYVVTKREDYASKVKALAASTAAYRHDGVHPDVFDNLTGEYIA